MDNSEPVGKLNRTTFHVTLLGSRENFSSLPKRGRKLKSLLWICKCWKSGLKKSYWTETNACNSSLKFQYCLLYRRESSFDKAENWIIWRNYGQRRKALTLDVAVTTPTFFLTLLFNSYFSFNAGVHESSPLKTGTPSCDDILLIANEIGSSWKMVGRVLNVPDAVIDQIEADESKVFHRCYSKCN